MAARRLGWVLLLAALLTGLLGMHGLQATSSPLHHHAAPAASSADLSMTDGGHGGTVAHHVDEICLALLVLALLLFTAVLGGVLPLRRASGFSSGRRAPPRARPPSLHQLSVLRI